VKNRPLLLSVLFVGALVAAGILRNLASESDSAVWTWLYWTVSAGGLITLIAAMFHVFHALDDARTRLKKYEDE